MCEKKLKHWVGLVQNPSCKAPKNREQHGVPSSFRRAEGREGFWGSDSSCTPASHRGASTRFQRAACETSRRPDVNMDWLWPYTLCLRAMRVFSNLILTHNKITPPKDQFLQKISKMVLETCFLDSGCSYFHIYVSHMVFVLLRKPWTHSRTSQGLSDLESLLFLPKP